MGWHRLRPVPHPGGVPMTSPVIGGPGSRTPSAPPSGLILKGIRVDDEFKGFPSISRLIRPVVVTEKLDGTNGIVFVSDDGVTVRAGSRNRWITPEADNYGFAQWVADHAEELRALGPGYHYGEWWGAGIARRYKEAKKRWSLFNVGRWAPGGADADKLPACCSVVPVLGELDRFDTDTVLGIADALKAGGSVASPGFMDPEGIVVFHKAAQALFKFTFGGDGHKSAKGGSK